MDRPQLVAHERRHARRRVLAPDDPAAVLRLRAAGDCGILNVSSSGALIHTLVRLEPGRHLEASILTRHGLAPIGGLVVRASVSELWSDRIVYQAALKFDRLLTL